MVGGYHPALAFLLQEMWKIRQYFTREDLHEQCNTFLMVVITHGTKSGKLLDVQGVEAFK